MQHAYGKPLHRSTIWRRLHKKEWKAWVGRRKKDGKPRLKPGRREDDARQQIYVEFVAAVLQLVNEKGYCNWADVRDYKTGSRFNYHQAEPRLLQAICESGFPPALMVVAVAELIPLNYVNRKLSTKAAYDRKFKGSLDWNAAEPLFEQAGSYSPFKEDGSDIDAALGWTDPKEDEKPAMRVIRGAKGTPAHQIRFMAGAELSLAMASYWRNHRLFRRCRVFLGKLLTKPVPLGPWGDEIAMVDHLFDEKMRKVRRLA
jgi:hypothetical protein